MENDDEYGCDVGIGMSVFGENIADGGFVADGGDGLLVALVALVVIRMTKKEGDEVKGENGNVESCSDEGDEDEVME